jgi:hypothetical protein
MSPAGISFPNNFFLFLLSSPGLRAFKSPWGTPNTLKIEVTLMDTAVFPLFYNCLLLGGAILWAILFERRK